MRPAHFVFLGIGKANILFLDIGKVNISFLTFSACSLRCGKTVIPCSNHCTLCRVACL